MFADGTGTNTHRHRQQWKESRVERTSVSLFSDEIRKIRQKKIMDRSARTQHNQSFKINHSPLGSECLCFSFTTQFSWYWIHKIAHATQKPEIRQTFLWPSKERPTHATYFWVEMNRGTRCLTSEEQGQLWGVGRGSWGIVVTFFWWLSRCTLRRVPKADGRGRCYMYGVIGTEFSDSWRYRLGYFYSFNQSNGLLRASY